MVKMIDLSESAVKLLKLKTAPQTISGGDRCPALSRVQPRLSNIWPHQNLWRYPFFQKGSRREDILYERSNSR